MSVSVSWHPSAPPEHCVDRPTTTPQVVTELGALAAEAVGDRVLMTPRAMAAARLRFD